MNKKFKLFIFIAKELNRNGITPVLYGSLGLSRSLGSRVGKINDIDLLVPEKFIKSKWNFLQGIMKNMKYEMINEHEHEFEKNGEIVNFGNENELEKFSNVNKSNLRMTKINEVAFKELTLNEYLKVYEKCLKDSYRQSKKVDADAKKIKLIKQTINMIK